jgi:hypothetical protein
MASLQAVAATKMLGDFGGFHVFSQPAPHLCVLFRKKVPPAAHRRSISDKRSRKTLKRWYKFGGWWWSDYWQLAADLFRGESHPHPLHTEKNGVLKCFLLKKLYRSKDNSFLTPARQCHRADCKGIFSRDFGTLFLISLDRIEGLNRAGSGLFFILMPFSCLNFKKLGLRGKDPSEQGILELLPSGGLLERGVPTLALHWSKES